MVHSCCVVGCTARQGPGISLHRIPNHPERRRVAWLRKIKRRLVNENLDWQPSSSTRICGRHFIEGKPNDKSDHPDYIPCKDMPGPDLTTVDLHRYKRAERRRLEASEVCPSPPTQTPEEVEAAATLLHLADPSVPGNSSSFQSMGSQTETVSFHDDMELLGRVRQHRGEMEAAQQEIAQLRAENILLSNQVKDSKFTFVNMRIDDFVFFTGITKPIFLWIFSYISSNVQFCYCHNGLPLHDHLLIVLMKLRLAFSNRYLAKKFCISESVISKLINQWIPKLAIVLKPLIVWPERDIVRSHVPSCFKPAYSKVVSIIDCFEVYTQRASNKTPRAQTWSNYKKNNTVKFLVSVTPAGAVSFISKGWGGRISDKQITCESGYLDHIIHGDEILADRGFLISEEVASRGAILKMPAFTKGKSQLSASEVISSKNLANVRIHVERVIGRMRNWEFIKNPVCLQQIHLLDNAVIIIAALFNINPSIVKDK